MNLKFLELKDESIFVKIFFFISIKVKPKRIEHLQEKEIIWSELYFNSCNQILQLNFGLISRFNHFNHFIKAMYGIFFSFSGILWQGQWISQDPLLSSPIPRLRGPIPAPREQKSMRKTHMDFPLNNVVLLAYCYNFT